MKINELQDKSSVDMLLLVGAVHNGTTNAGNPYLSITFKDSTGSLDSKLWDVKPAQEEICKPGKIIRVKGQVNLYKNNLQLKVLSVEDVDQSTIDPTEFVQSVSVSIDDLKQTIYSAIDEIENADLKAIVSTIYQKYDKEIFSFPAAQKNHHEFYGGLASHTASMTKLAKAICQLYPGINEDLLISGVLLHDIGKIFELNGAVVTEYTIEGKLLGHISIAQAIVKEVADELNIDNENVILLRHMILSHHGQYDFGSPVLPAIKEAEILHYIDDLDAKINMMNKELEHVKPGEFSNRIYSLDNRAFYKPKGE